MDLLSHVSRRIRSQANWIDVAQKIGINDHDIEQIKERNNCAAEFVNTLTNKIWNVFLDYANITSSSNGFVDINIEKVLREIASRLGDWRKFARILGLEESNILAIEKMFPSPGLYIQRTLEVMKKFSHPLPPTTSWEFWRRYLTQFEDGKVVIGEIEMNFPNLLAEVSDTGEHMISAELFNYVGHPFDHKRLKSFFAVDQTPDIPVRIGAENILDLQSLSQWMKSKRDYAKRYSILKEINSLNFADMGNNKCPILKTLKDYLEETGDSGYVVKGYHFFDHICLLKPALVKKEKYDDQYFCFVANDGIVLYITVCSQDNNTAIYHSTRNIQIANLLHKELNSNDIVQINVIVYNDNANNAFCKTCMDDRLYVKESVFKYPEKFSKWYKDILSNIKSKFKSTSRRITQQCNDTCQAVKKEMIMYEALENVALPSFTLCAEDQVEEQQKLILLTPPQDCVLHSSNKHVLIRGCYGSGKTVVLQKMFDNNVRNCNAYDINYLICNDQQSDSIYLMKREQSKFPDKHVIICRSADIIAPLDKPSLSNILNAIRELWRDKYVHVFIDEFNCSFIDKDEIKKLKEVLNFFENSRIVVALQSLEEHVYLENNDGVDFGYQYSVLVQETSFVCYNLPHCLRSSYEINEFVKETSSFLEDIKQKTSYIGNYQSAGKMTDKEYGMENYNSLYNKFRDSLQENPVVTYSFNQRGNLGNNIRAGLVKVYFFDVLVSYMPSNPCILYCSILNHILKEVSVESKYVICTYDKDLYNAVFSYLQQNDFYWTNKIDEFIVINNQYEVLLTDCASIRGYEFANFILMIPLAKTFLRFRFIESLARAMTNLFVLTDNIKVSLSITQRLDHWLWNIFRAQPPKDIELIQLWRESEMTCFHDVIFDKKKDNIIILKGQKKVFVCKNASKNCLENVDMFPWGKSIALQHGDSHADSVTFTIYAICVHDDANLCKEFLENNNIDINEYSNTWKADLLELTIKYNAEKCMNFFISDFDFDIYGKASSEKFALQSAISYKRVKIINSLMQRHPKLDNILYGPRTIGKILTGDVDNVNLKNEHGNTLLYEASCCGEILIVETLIKYKAAINMKNSEGNTALHAACYNGHLSVCKLLVENEANINIKNDLGEIPPMDRFGNSNPLLSRTVFLSSRIGKV